MRRVRQLKKSQNFVRSVESQSRQIISSIYASALENDQLEFAQGEDFWNISPQNLKKSVEKPTVTQQQPLNHLLPLLKHLSKGKVIDACSFIIFDNNSIQTVTQQERIKIYKNKKEKNKLRYWLSHIHFQKLRRQLAEQLMSSSDDSDGHRQIVHFNEEKEYMPLAFSAKKEASTLIRQIKVSSEVMYSKQGELQRQPFCIAYFNNGAEQLFSFTEILSFIEYPFNLAEISYFKIIPAVCTPIFKSLYSKNSFNCQRKELVDKFKKVIRQQERWKLAKEELDQMKNQKIRKGDFEGLAELLLLETVSFLEVNEFIQIENLSLQWLIDEEGNALLSNCYKYHYSSLNNFRSSDGLATLFEKNCMEKSLALSNTEETQRSFRVKKMRSQEKKVRQIHPKFQSIKWRSESNKSQILSENISTIRKKTRSCIRQKRTTKNLFF